MSDIGVYRITHTESGKVYIGSSASLKHRLYCHKWDLKKSKHHSFLLQRAWDKYGEEAFVFEVIEHCEREELPVREQHWIDHYTCADPANGYNRSPTAGTTAGCVKTAKTRARISASKMGSVPWNKGVRGAQKWAESDSRWKTLGDDKRGLKRDPGIGAKISASKKGKPAHPNSTAAARAARLGKPGHKNQKSKLKELWADPVWRANMLEKRRL